MRNPYRTRLHGFQWRLQLIGGQKSRRVQSADRGALSFFRGRGGRGYWVALLFWMLCGSGMTAVCHAQTSNELWQKFREENPLHVQAVLLSERNRQGEQTLIIAEPPPSVSPEDLKKILPSPGRLRIGRTRVGADGWVSDVVVDLPKLTDATVNSLVVELHEKLFGTAYKAYTLPLPLPKAAAGAKDLDLHVTAGQMQKWFIGDVQERDGSDWTIGRGLFLLFLAAIFFWRVPRLVSAKRVFAGVSTAAVLLFFAYHAVPTSTVSSSAGVVRFIPVAGHGSYTIQYLLRHPSPGVYRSMPNGFVVWCVPKNRKLNEFRLEARQFSLDSDLLVGGIANQESALIIGRERSVPVTVLPPIRSETVMQLAAVKERELGQSYERKFMYAGRFLPAEALDWAPIYLSEQLINTEFGSLLNIADQLLKSWSLHGEVDYINFPYPRPSVYPFDKPLIDELGTDELTFNWNTGGAAYVEQSGDIQIFSLGRTGALPIDYLARGKENVRKAEDAAYDWYSALGDPNLVRIAEYTGLYQLFTRFGIQAHAEDIDRAPPSFPLAKWTSVILARFADVDLSRWNVDSADSKAAAFVDRARRNQAELRRFMKEASPQQKEQLIRYLSDSSQFQAALKDKDESTQAVIGFAAEFGSFFQQFVDDIDRMAAMKAYQASARTWADSGKNTTAWIGTPSIVISKATGSLQSVVGGHNLWPDTVEFKVDSGLGAGKFRIEQAGDKQIVFHSASDSPNIGSAARISRRNQEIHPERLKSEIEETLRAAKQDTRTMSETLRLASLETTTGNSLGLNGNRSRFGWEPGAAKRSESIDAVLNAFSSGNNEGVAQSIFVVTRNPDFTYAIDGLDGTHLTAFNLPAAVDAVKTVGAGKISNEQLSLYLRGMDAREAKGFLHSTEAQFGGADGGRIKVLREGSMSPEEIKTLQLAKYDFKTAEITKLSKPTMVAGKAVIDAEVNITAHSWFGKHIVLRIRLIFDTLADASRFVKDELKIYIERLGDGVDVILAAHQLKRDLQVAHPGVSAVDITIFRHDSKDLYLVDNRKKCVDEADRFS